jgi:hypothetical protein
VTAKNKEGKLGGNFNLYSLDQHLWKEPIDLPKWAQEFYSKSRFLDVGNSKDNNDDSVSASVLSKRPSGWTKSQAQAWAQEKKELHLKPKSSSTTGSSSSNFTGDNDGGKRGRPNDEFLVMLKESVKEMNAVLKSFGTRDDQSNQLEALKQCNQLLQNLDKNVPESARLSQAMTSRALKNGMSLLDQYNKPTGTVPPPALSIQGHIPQFPLFAHSPYQTSLYPPSSQPWQQHAVQPRLSTHPNRLDDTGDVNGESI